MIIKISIDKIKFNKNIIIQNLLNFLIDLQYVISLHLKFRLLYLKFTILL
jgi:hypothetical protein